MRNVPGSVACFVAAILCLAPSLSSQQAPRTETRIFDVSSLVEPLVDVPQQAFGLPIRNAYRRIDEPFFVGNENVAGIGVEEVINVIRTTIVPDSWEQPGMRISVLANRSLVVTQTAEALDRVGALIADLADAAHQSIDVEALVIDASHAAVAGYVAQGGIVPAAAFESMRAGREQGMRIIFSGSTPATSGRRAGIVDVKSVPINGDFDVEVAQTAQIADPRIIQLNTGTSIYVRPTILEDGRINLRVQANITGDPSVTAFVTASPSLGKVQLPAATLTQVTANGVVNSGEAFVAGTVAGDDEPRRLVVVRASVRAKKQKESNDRIRLFDMSYLSTMRSGAEVLAIGPSTGKHGAQGGFEEGGVDTMMARESEGIDAGQITDMIRTTVSPRKWDESGNAMWIDGSRLICIGDRDLLGGVHDLLNGLTASRARFVSVGIYVVTIPRATLANLRANQNDAWLRQVMRSPETARRYSGATMAELGTSVDLLSGREAAYIADYNAEIAQGASISDPVIETYFAGVYARIMPYHGGARGRFGLHFKATIADAPREAEVFDGGGADFGRLQEPRIRSQIVAGSTMVDDKDYVLLGEISTLGSADDVGLVIAQVAAVPESK